MHAVTFTDHGISINNAAHEILFLSVFVCDALHFVHAIAIPVATPLLFFYWV